MAGGRGQCPDFFGDTVMGPTCQIAALLYALVSDAEGSYLNRLSQRKPLSISDICPAKLVTWHPVIPNGSYPLYGPRQPPPRVRLDSNAWGPK